MLFILRVKHASSLHTLLVTLKTWSTWLNVTVVICCNLQYIGETKRRLKDKFRACLHGDGGPQVGEVTRLGGVTRFSIQSLISHLIWSRLHDRWGDPPYFTSPTWGPPPPCKQALNEHRRPVDKSNIFPEHFLSHSDHFHTDIQLISLEKINSSRDSVRKARQSQGHIWLLNLKA